MANIFDSIDKGSLTKLKAIIDMKDSKEFAGEYKMLLEDCYSCHKTANRPYLRPQVPTTGAQPIAVMISGRCPETIACDQRTRPRTTTLRTNGYPLLPSTRQVYRLRAVPRAVGERQRPGRRAGYGRRKR